MRLALVMMVATAAVARANLVYPMFKQCDPRWGNNTMGTKGPGEQSTICGEGCAMSCVSMALNGLKYTVDGAALDPGTFNAWLEDHDGYHCMDGDCNNLILTMIDKFTNGHVTFVGENLQQKPSVEEIQNGLEMNSTIYLAHVRNRTHFVLVTGWNAADSNFFVNDPNHDIPAYNYSDMADLIVYRIHPQNKPVVPTQYPLFSQCDPRWGNDTMNSTTICEVGCLMSSLSMVLNEKAILISGQAVTPQVLNAWLRDNGGYDGDNDLQESVVPMISPARISWPANGKHTTNDIPFDTIMTILQSGQPVIANVMNGAHFVLVIGYDPVDGDTLYVNDPYFNIRTYSYTRDIVGWRMFVTQPGAPATQRLRGAIAALF